MSYIKFIKESYGDKISKKMSRINESTSYKSLSKMPEEFRSNRDFIIGLIERIPCQDDLYRYIDKELKSDLDVFKVYFDRIGTDMKYIPMCVKNNADMIAYVLNKNESPEILEWIAKNLICTPKKKRKRKC